MLRGCPEIAYGNVSGSILVFYLFNAGIIALIHLLRVPDSVLKFYLPVSLATVLFLTFLMARLVIPLWAGGILVPTYFLYFSWGDFRPGALKLSGTSSRMTGKPPSVRKCTSTGQWSETEVFLMNLRAAQRLPQNPMKTANNTMAPIR